MNLDDIRRLNLREVGNWPMLPKLGALALLVLVIVALGAFFDWKDQYETLETARAQEKMADFYAELPINIRITGNYHDMGAFASDVAQLPRIVTLNDLVINNEKGVLALEGVAKTFRYLDEEEVAKQRALARAKEKEKAKK